MRVVLPVSLLLFAACKPPEPAEVCPDYVAALAGCYDAAEVAVPADVTVDALCPADDLLDGEVYVCLAAKAEAADCATERGIVDLGVELDRCL